MHIHLVRRDNLVSLTLYALSCIVSTDAIAIGRFRMVSVLTEIPKDYLEAFTAVLLKIQVFWSVRLCLG